MSGVKVKEWHRLHKLAEDCGEEGTCGNAVITCRKHLKEFATYWEIEAINTASRLEAVEAKLRAVETYATSLRQRVIDRESDTPEAREWDDGLLMIADEIDAILTPEAQS